MQESGFNIFVEYDSKTILYNTFTRALLLCDDIEVESINARLRNPEVYTSDDLTETLIENGILVTSRSEELQQLILLNKMSRFQTQTFSLQIVMTLNCNLRCSYCFEERRNDRLEDTVKEGILSLLARKVPHLNYLTVEWFGGEPLLALKGIITLNTKIRRLCSDHGCEYVPSLTTNGVLLTSARINELLEENIKVVQVTIDGPLYIHDSRRMGPQNKPTFERILENVENALQRGMTVSVRINLDKQNVSSIDELLAVLKERKLHRDVIYYFKRVFPPSFSRTYMDLPLSNEEYSKVVFDLRRKAKNLGFKKISMISYDHPQTCVAESVNQYQIGPTGELYKCAEVFESFERMGILPVTGHEELESMYYEWMGKEITSDPVCSACQVLPLCWGGCHAARFKSGVRECSEIKYSIDQFIIGEFEQTLNAETEGTYNESVQL